MSLLRVGEEVELTPMLLARAFWAMDTTEQTEFFEKLADVITEETPTAYGYGEMQWCYLKDEIRKNPKAADMHRALSLFAYDYLPLSVA